MSAEADRVPGYAALSYVWGDTKYNLHPIFVDGNKVHWATHNLWQALKRIRATYEDRVLWVDAICINQENNEERSSQVREMRWIFPKASCVLCWLGDDDETVPEAFSELKTWASAHNDETSRSSCVLDARRHLAERKTGQRNALSLLFSRPYFTRAWCLPEVCVPPRNALVLCGLNEISWRRLYFGFLTMASSIYEDELIKFIGPSVTRVIPMLNVCWNPPEKMLLSYLIPLVANRECQDPHDKIFSLLGLAERSGGKYPPANYRWSMRDVCITYTRAAIEVERRLDILRAICPYRENDCMPSWCLKSDQWLKDRTAGELELLNGHLFEKYRACGGMTIDLVPARARNDGVLRIYGFNFDRITHLYDLSDFLTGLFYSPTHWSDIFARTRNFCHTIGLPDLYAATDELVVEAFLNTLCFNDFWIQSPKEKAPFRRELLYKTYEKYAGGIFSEDRTSLGASGSILEESQLFDYMARTFVFGQSTSDEINIDHEPGPSITHSILEKQAIMELSNIVEQKVGSRKLIVTEKGHIGFGLQSCAVLDEVCLIPGSDVPLVLRNTSVLNTGEPSHVFVSDAYIHGIMYGEGLEDYSRLLSASEKRCHRADMTLFYIS